MKIAARSVTALFVLLILLMACNEEEEQSKFSQAEMWDCHHEMDWDSSTIKNALIGEWEWEYIRCLWNAEDANEDEFAGLVINFRADDILEVVENDQTTQTSSWRVVDGDGDLFALEVEPRVNLLYGRILFCDDRVEFNHSYIDGCDNFFTRKK